MMCPWCKREDVEVQLKNVPIEDEAFTGLATSYVCNLCHTVFAVAVDTSKLLWKQTIGD